MVYVNEGAIEERVHSQRVEERCLRHTGIGWLSSDGGPTDVLLSSATVKRRRTSASRHEFGDFGLIFTPEDTFMFPSLQRGTEQEEKD